MTPRTRRRRDHVAARVALAALVSLLANGLLLWLAILWGAFDLGKPVKVSQVALAPLSASDWARNRGTPPLAAPDAARAERAEPPRPAPPPPPPPELQNPQRRFATAPPGADEAPPPDARHFGAEDRKVEKETVSRFARGHDGQVLPAPSAGARGEDGADRTSRPGEAEEQAKRPEPRRSEQEQLARVERARDGLLPPERRDTRRDPAKGPERSRDEEDTRASEARRRLLGPTVPDLSPRPGLLGAPAGAPDESGMDEGLEEGDATALNIRKTEEGKYLASFRAKLGKLWRSKTYEAIGERDPELRIFFYKDRTAVVGISVDASGAITDMRLLQTSNVDFFDRVALDSLRQVAPFPRPPASLLNRTGEYQFVQAFTADGPRSAQLWNWRPDR